MRVFRHPPDRPVEKNECRADQDESRGKCRAVSRLPCLQLIGSDAGFIQQRFVEIDSTSKGMDATAAAKVPFAKCWSKHLGHRGGAGGGITLARVAPKTKR